MSNRSSRRSLIVVNDDDLLYRRLAPHSVNRDESVNSSAFKRSGVYETEISVDLARLTDPWTSVQRAGRAGFRLGALTAAAARLLGFVVEHDPLPENDAHTTIRGLNDQEISRALARATRLILGVESQDLAPNESG